MFSEFNGPAYEAIKALEKPIYGPSVILDCIEYNAPLPNKSLPLYNIKFQNVQICFSGINSTRKTELSNIIQMMDGDVSKQLTRSVRFLITANVETKKYLVAHSINITTLLPDWILDIWELSKSKNKFDPFSAELLKQYKVPIFNNLKICLSGFPQCDEETYKSIITSNGGQYYSELKNDEVTHLLTNNIVSEKYLLAKQSNIKIGYIDWLKASMEKGYCQDINEYMIDEDFFILDDDIFDADSGGFATKPDNKINPKKLFSRCVMVFDSFDADFIAKWTEIVVNHSGKVVKTLDTDVTHVIIGESSILNSQPGMSFVNKCWLESSMAAGKCVPVDEFLANVDWFDDCDFSDFDFDEDSNDGTTSGRVAIIDTKAHDKAIFHDISFFIDGNLSEYSSERLVSRITANGGRIVDQSSDARYIVCEMFVNHPYKLEASATLVTGFFVSESLNHNRLLVEADDFLYRPIVVDANASDLLAGCVVAFVGFEPTEAHQLSDFTAYMGAAVQEVLLERDCTVQRLRACTHIVAGERSPKEYRWSGAWNVPVVTREWLHRSVVEKRRLATDAFLVGGQVRETVASSSQAVTSSSQAVASTSQALASTSQAVASTSQAIASTSQAVAEPSRVTQVSDVAMVIVDADAAEPVVTGWILVI